MRVFAGTAVVLEGFQPERTAPERVCDDAEACGWDHCRARYRSAAARTTDALIRTIRFPASRFSALP
jgi:hypothetical protein